MFVLESVSFSETQCVLLLEKKAYDVDVLNVVVECVLNMFVKVLVVKYFAFYLYG